MYNENCFKGSSSRKFIIIFLVIAIIVTSLNVSIYAESEQTLEDKIKEGQKAETDPNEGFELSSSVYYPNYLSTNEGEGYTDYKGEYIDVDLKDVKLPENYDVKDYTADKYTPSEDEYDTDIEGSLFIWENEDLKWAEFNVDVAEKGFYNIEIEYYTPRGSVQTPQRSINIDGKLPFLESSTVDFMRRWEDESKTPIYNTVDDQIRPKQLEVFGVRTMRISDHDGKYSLPLKYALDSGNHKIRFLYQYEGLVIKSIKLASPVENPTYEEKLSEWKAAGITEADGSFSLKKQGEDVDYKTDPSLRMDGSSDPAADPSYEKGSTRLNVIGGSTWASSNQTLLWKINIPEGKEGLYKISLRAYSRYTDGVPVYRQIKVNGEIPFKEFECYEIPFEDWSCYSLNQPNGVPYLVYLKPGENTIEMTVKFGVIADIMNALTEDADRLSELIKDITKVTGTSPDANFDYRLENVIENLVGRLQAISDSFGTQISRIESLSTKRPSAINNFINMQDQFNRMIKNTDIIAKNYTELTNAMTNLSLWIKEFGKLPMQIDYIEILAPDAEVKVIKSTFWQKLAAAFASFIVSFTKDYDSVGGVKKEDGTVDEEVVVLDVWVSRGKEWAEILKQNADETFYEENKISVQMNILPSGQLNASASSVLLLALASGTGPDVALGVASNLPVEYGMRGAIYDISNFEDFSIKNTDESGNEYDEGIMGRFLSGIMIPFQFEGGYYGLPETMDFQCLYYRKDIIYDSEYNLEIPDTWTDVYSKILPVLKNNGMDFYYAGGYNPFLFQNNGEYFYEDSEGNTVSAWNADGAVKGFKQWTDLYTVYDVPVTADFYNRFRSGQMPMGIGGIDIYTKLVSAAPEITGKWGVAPIPGNINTDENGNVIYDEDGNPEINRSAGGGTTACVILNDSQNKEEAWKFLKWYTSRETQVTYANDIKAIIGPEAIWASANVEAFNELPWDAELKDVIEEYQKWYKDAPNVVGGYIVARYLENARVAVVVEKKLYRPSLERAVSEIDRELKIKNEEFDRRAEFEAEKAKKEAQKNNS